MDFAFILDPLPELRAYKDSSISMMRELARRGHRLFALEQGDLLWDAGRTCGRARPLEVFGPTTTTGIARATARCASSREFAAVMMRKDPPFDMEYVYSTYLLECAEREGARVFNRPRAIRDNNEKLSIAKFPQFTAPTLVTRDSERIGEFIDDARRRGGEAARRHGRHLDVPRRRGGPQPQRDRRDGVAPRPDDGDGAALPAGDRRRRQAHPPRRRRGGSRTASRASRSRARRAATSPRAGAARRGR